MWPVVPPPDEIINAVVTCLNLLKDDIAHGGKDWRQKKAVEFYESEKKSGAVIQ